MNMTSKQNNNQKEDILEKVKDILHKVIKKKLGTSCLASLTLYKRITNNKMFY